MRPFLDLDRDYAAAERTFLSDPVLAQAAQYGRGYASSGRTRLKRLLPLSFLKTTIYRASAGWYGGSARGSAPRSAAGITPFLCRRRSPDSVREDLAPVRAGFRAKYAVDAARRVCDGSVPLGRLASLPYAQAQALLMTIRGVGVKVADCVLLFGAGRLEAFPVDVWMKRACARFYPGGQAPEFGPYAGLAQQYLFHYVRGLSA